MEKQSKAAELNAGIRSTIEQLANETDAARQSELFRNYLRASAAFWDEFRVTSLQLSQQGEHSADWEVLLGGTKTTGIPIRWRTNRIWKEGLVVAEFIRSLP